MKKTLLSIALASALLLTACGTQDLGLTTDTKEASQYTIDANDQVYALLDFEDKGELENAKRGLIVAPNKLESKT